MRRNSSGILNRKASERICYLVVVRYLPGLVLIDLFYLVRVYILPLPFPFSQQQAREAVSLLVKTSMLWLPFLCRIGRPRV